jgi:hypothetical protein
MVVYKGKLLLFGGFYDAAKETKCARTEGMERNENAAVFAWMHARARTHRFLTRGRVSVCVLLGITMICGSLIWRR